MQAIATPDLEHRETDRSERNPDLPGKTPHMTLGISRPQRLLFPLVMQDLIGGSLVGLIEVDCLDPIKPSPRIPAGYTHLDSCVLA